MSHSPKFAPGQHPVPVQRAATVLLLREGAAGLEVFVQHRATTMDFAAGVVVYPGGRVDEQDVAASGQVPVAVAAEHARLWEKTSLWASGAEQARFASAVVAAAARREVWEETGTELLPGQLHPWANWVTPQGNPKRFDTFFYIAALEGSQQPRHQTTEATISEWVTPATLFAATEAGALRLMAPTRSTLQAVAALGSLEAVLARNEVIQPVPPRLPSGAGPQHTGNPAAGR